MFKLALLSLLFLSVSMAAETNIRGASESSEAAERSLSGDVEFYFGEASGEKDSAAPPELNLTFWEDNYDYDTTEIAVNGGKLTFDMELGASFLGQAGIYGKLIRISDDIPKGAVVTCTTSACSASDLQTAIAIYESIAVGTGDDRPACGVDVVHTFKLASKNPVVIALSTNNTQGFLGTNSLAIACTSPDIAKPPAGGGGGGGGGGAGCGWLGWFFGGN